MTSDLVDPRNTDRRFRADQDGPGWRAGDIFTFYASDIPAGWALVGKDYPRMDLPQVTHGRYFTEITGPRKIAIYELDITDFPAHEYDLRITHPVRIEERDA